MTMPIRFDTQQYIKILMEGGHSQEQAEAQAQALTTALAEGTNAPSELLVVKIDLLARMDTLRAELSAYLDLRIKVLEAKLQSQINSLRGLVILSLALHAVEIAALIAILRKLPG